MKKCVNCGATLGVDAARCGNCGAPCEKDVALSFVKYVKEKRANETKPQPESRDEDAIPTQPRQGDKPSQAFAQPLQSAPQAQAQAQAWGQAPQGAPQQQAWGQAPQGVPQPQAWDQAPQGYPQQQAWNQAPQGYPQQPQTQAWQGNPYQQQAQAWQAQGNPYQQQAWNQASQGYPYQPQGPANFDWAAQQQFMAQQAAIYGGDTYLWPETPDFKPKNFGDTLSICFSKYCRFQGRATRSEYWQFYAWGWIFGLVPYVNIIFMLAAILPSLGVFVRRLHDSNRSGWNFCWFFLPIVGWIILFVYLLSESTRGPNRFGPEPIRR